MPGFRRPSHKLCLNLKVVYTNQERVDCDKVVYSKVPCEVNKSNQNKFGISSFGHRAPTSIHIIYSKKHIIYSKKHIYVRMFTWNCTMRNVWSVPYCMYVSLVMVSLE